MTSASSLLIALWSAACAAAVAALIAADRRGWAAGRVVFKLAASSCFVALALALGATGSAYGRWVLGALLLGWLGDALLLSRRAPAFLAGLGAFLLAHALYAVAFLQDLRGPAAGPALALAALLAGPAGWAVWRWLAPHLSGGFRLPVAVYVTVILGMVCAAAGHAADRGAWAVLAGALLFAVSDLAVARDRFVQRSPTNKLWGWPTYFGAQLLLAASVARPG